MAKHLIILLVVMFCFACGEDRPAGNVNLPFLPYETNNQSGGGGQNQGGLPTTDVTDEIAVADGAGSTDTADGAETAGSGSGEPIEISIMNVLAFSGVAPVFYPNLNVVQEEGEEEKDEDETARVPVWIGRPDDTLILAPSSAETRTPAISGDILSLSLPDPVLELGGTNTPWLIGFESTGGLVKYINSKTSKMDIQYDKEMEFNGEIITCDSYITAVGEGSPLNEDEPGKILISWCRQKVKEGGIGTDSHYYLYWDWISYEISHFAFWNGCLGNVVVDGSVKPVKKGIVSYYDKLGMIGSNFTFSGALSYTVKNDKTMASSVAFSGLSRKFFGKLKEGIEKTGLYGNVSVGGKGTLLKNPNPIKDSNGVYTNLELFPAQEVVECFEESL